MAHLRFDSPFDGKSPPEEPTRFNHGLAGHDLLSLDALARLAQRLDEDRVEYNSGSAEPDQDPDKVAGVDLDPPEVVRQIETCGAWMVLKNVETVPEYRELLEACFTDVLETGEQSARKKDLWAAGFRDIQGFIFVASPGSVTPFHVDYEENFFVHLKGPKAMHVFDNRDRSFVSEPDLETYPGKHRNLAYRRDFEERAIVHTFEPGDGLYLPYTWPHWVRTGDAPAVSMAITWKSPAVLNRNTLLFANAVLRRAGLAQPLPGRFPIYDRTKVLAFNTARALIEPLRRSERSRRFLRNLFFGEKANYYYRNRGEEA
ncbi:MAG: cupin-like domain-containing protein [Pseudomonadota bacterium]